MLHMLISCQQSSEHPPFTPYYKMNDIFASVNKMTLSDAKTRWQPSDSSLLTVKKKMIQGHSKKNNSVF